MNEKTKNAQAIYVARYTMIKEGGVIRRAETAVTATSEKEAWEVAAEKIRKAGIENYKIDSVKPFL